MKKFLRNLLFPTLLTSTFCVYAPIMLTGPIISAYAQADGIRWRKECAGIVNSQYMSDAYCGGIKVGSESTPVFCDTDNDGDLDMFVGHGYLDSGIYFFRNDGTTEVPNWTLVTENYNSIVTSWFNTPTFCDIDNDGDYDMFIGNYEEGINFYRNDGTPEVPIWEFVTWYYTNTWDGACTFCDIDNDGDYDMFVLGSAGKINFYRNDGTPEVPNWTLVTGNYYSDFLGEDITTLTTPTFHDIDNDGDYDMFVPEMLGHVRFYKNDGTPKEPNWTLVTENYDSTDVVGGETLRFCDIDNDGDYDMFMGESGGGIRFWRNMGLEKTLSADFNNDGIVNFYDLSKFAEQWLMTEEWYDGE
jgi:hypothetical protein